MRQESHGQGLPAEEQDGPVVPVVDWPERAESGDWLRGDKAVVVITVDVDAESPVLARGEHYIDHLTTMSHQAYGPRVGVPRILELLRSLDIPSTFFMPGASAERWPAVVESVLEHGHEIGLHGFTHRHPVHLSEQEQRAELENNIETLARFGVTPRGYRAPNWEMTRFTLDLLPEHGVRYDSSLMDDDRPYTVLAGSGRNRLAELPVQWLLDDWEQYAFLPEPNIGQQIEVPGKVFDLWTAELDAMRDHGSLCVLTVHPFLTGRPSRLRALESFVGFARDCGDVRFASACEVADLVLDSESFTP